MKVLRPFIFAFSLSFAVLPNAARCGWGVEVGRASLSDLNDLAHAEQSLWSSEKAIARAVGEALVIERQRQLLGTTNGAGVERLFHLTFAWWLKSVLKPAVEIPFNPAASCAEARLGLQKLLELDRQRQLLGLAPQQDPPADANAAETDNWFKELWDKVLAATTRRCQDEALDECVYTGRMMAVIELVFSADRQAQLRGQDSPDTSWATDALNQCAIYKVKFKSTGNVSRTATHEGYKREVYGTVVIRPGLSGLVPSIVGLSLPPEAMQLTGVTLNDPLFGSITCEGTDPGNPGPGGGIVVVDFCGPGPTDIVHEPIKVIVAQAFDLEHFIYDVTGVDFTRPGSDKVKVTRVGQDQLTLMFVPGPISVPEKSHFEMHGSKYDLPDATPEVFAGIYLAAHIRAGMNVVFKDSGSALDILSLRKDSYPVLLKYTFPPDTEPTVGARGEIYMDTTEFEVSHQPEPKPFTPRDNSLLTRIDQKIDELANLP
jgi:hypothetical protein